MSAARHLKIANLTLMLLFLTSCHEAELPQNKLTALCEEKLKSTLLSPSGYKRVDLKQNYSSGSESVVGNKAIVAGVKLSGEELRELNTNYNEATIFSRTFEYDAPNQFGTPIRSKKRCDYYSSERDMKAIKADRIVLVDEQR